MQLQKLSALELTGILGIAYASWRVLVFMAKLVAAARIPSRVYEKLPSAASDSHSANRTVVELSAPPTARAILASVEAGHRTIAEVVDEFIARAKACTAVTNCCVPVEAMTAAAIETSLRLDAEGTTRDELPLRGLPVSIKECYLVHGTPSTHGLQKYAAKICTDPAREATLVQILRRLGAVPFCKTNVPQIMYAWECSNSVYGTTSHPLHRNFIPGGSSGGEATLIAQGGSVVGLGSDVGGSCRFPAHMAGCVGLKLTLNRVSMRGKGLDTLYGGGQQIVASCNGFLSRTVDDMVVVLEAVLSDDAIVETRRTLDVHQLPLPWNVMAYESVAPLTIGYYDDDGFMEASPACRRAVRLSVERLEAAGHTLVPFNPPNVELAFHIYVALMSSGADLILDELKGEPVAVAMSKMIQSASAPAVVKPILATLLKGKSPLWAKILPLIGPKTTTEYYEWVAKAGRYKSAFMDAMNAAEVDALLCPVHALPSHPQGSTVDFLPSISYSAIFNLLDYAAGTVPVTSIQESEGDGVWPHDASARNVRGLKLDANVEVSARKAYARTIATGVAFPVGVQVVARPLEEELVLRVLRELEVATQEAAEEEEG